MARGIPAGTLAALLPGVAMLAVMGAPAGTLAAAGPQDVRVSDVEISDEGSVSVVVAVPALRSADGDPTGAFEVREDGQDRDVDATPLADGDVEVALVLDTSAGQTAQQLRELRNIAMELALRLPRESPMALVSSGEPPLVVQPATTDVLERAAATGQLEPRGARATYDALVLAVDALPGRPGARRMVVLLGQGEDETSSTTANQLRDRLEAADAALYVIDPSADGAHPLDDLAEATGGLVVPIRGDHPPLEAATTVLADVLHQFRLVFEPRGSGDTTVSIRVVTEAVSAETALSVWLPTPRGHGGAAGPGVPGSPSPSRTQAAPARAESEPAPNRTWLPAAAALSALLLLAGGALLAERPAGGQHALSSAGVVRRIAGRQAGRHRAPDGAAVAPRVSGRPGAPHAPAGAGGGLRLGLLQGGRARAAPAGPSVSARAGAIVSTAVAATKTQMTRLRPALRRAGAALHEAGASAPLRTPSGTGSAARAWRDAAEQVHAEVGGDLRVLHDAADRVVAARAQTAAALRRVGFQGRLATVLLTLLPLAVGVFRYLVDPAYLERLTGEPLGLVGLVAAVTLTAAGGLWLHRIAQPPFAALPASWRAYDERIAREGEIADALDRASLYAVAGLDLDSALERSVRDHDQYAHPLLHALRTLDKPPDSGGPPAEGRTPDWLPTASRWLPAPALLATVRANLHDGWVREAKQHAHNIPALAVPPLVACIVPATAIVGLAA